MSHDEVPSNSPTDQDLEVARVLDRYLADLEAGRPADPDRLLAEHPHIAEELRAGLDVVHWAGAALQGSDAVNLHERSASNGHSRASIETTSGSGDPPSVLLRDPLGQPSSILRPIPSRLSAQRVGDGRYQLLGEIARGGMGAVLKGHDSALNRELAIKVLLSRHCADAEVLHRFLEEAQIGGQLQHPGIVPVYDLGTLPDRRPFFAMKLVRGRTLAAHLAERTDPAQDRTRFLGIFLQVCQTMAYAHARGVIHRDLKPSNVMVGSFGEVQVMDWGLAKVLPEGGVADERPAPPSAEVTVKTVRSGSDGDRSRVGSVLGTAAYMPPEQARGEVEWLDERADVFGLGAILCEVLTGRPPYVNRSPREARRMAAASELEDALSRIDASAADVEIRALARRCLAPEKQHRPRDAGEVAETMTAYFEAVQDRLRQAEFAKVEAQTRAEEEVKQRELAEELADEAQARAIEERRRRKLQVGLAAAVLALFVLGSGGLAWEQRQRSERLAKTARGVENALTRAALLRGEAQAAPVGELAKWTEALAVMREAESLIEQGEADAPSRGRVNDLLAALQHEQAEARERAEQAEIDRTLLADLESIRGNFPIHYDAKRADAEFANAFRKAGLDLDTTEPILAGAWIAKRPAPAVLCSYLDEWSYYRRSTGAKTATWRRLIETARAADLDKWRDALRDKTGFIDDASIAEFRRLSEDEATLDAQPAISLFLLSISLKDTKDKEDRERAARILRRAWRSHPEDFWINFMLAMVHSTGTTADEAFPYPEEAVRHLSAAVSIRPRSQPAHHNLGLAFFAQGKLDEAIAQCRAAIRLKPDQANAHYSLGFILNEQGKLDEGIAEIREAIRLEPDNAYAHGNLGRTLHDQGKFEEAIAEIREAIRLKPDNAAFHANLGGSLNSQSKFEEAAAECRAAIRLKPDNASAHSNLGNALKDLGKLEDAIAEYHTAIRLKPDDPYPHYNLGLALAQQNKLEQAASEFRAAIRIKPYYSEAHYDLGLTLASQRKVDEAIVEYREAIRFKPESAEPHCNLGNLLLLSGSYSEALEELRRGHELGSKRPGWRYPSAQWVRRCERMVALDARLSAVLNGDDKPANAEEGLTFAEMCYTKALYATAARFWADAFTADPRRADDRQAQPRYNAACAAALAAAGKGKDDPAPDESDRARLRQQALGWLKAEIVAWGKILDTVPAAIKARVVPIVQHWKDDSDLAAIRDADDLARLPEAERKEWQALWAEVEALLKRAQEPKP